MPRTIVYDPPAIQAAIKEGARAGQPLPAIAPLARRDLRHAAEVKVAASQTGTPAAGTPRDDYFSRIAKYVPAEMVTLTMLGFGAFDPTGLMAVGWICGGAIANMLYLLGQGLSGNAEQRPRWFFYLLSALAYPLWAAATIDQVGSALGLTGANIDSKKAFVLATASFLIPALDMLFEHIGRGQQRQWWPRGHQSKAETTAGNTTKAPQLTGRR